MARVYPFAAVILRFYEQVAGFQRDLYARVLSASSGQVEKRNNGSLREKFDVSVILPRFPAFLSLIQQVGPAPLARLANELMEQGSDRWINLLTAYWTEDSPDDFLAENPALFFPRAFLQPYAEYLAHHTEYSSTGAAPRVCPLCGERPQVGVLRQEGDGAKRSLICSLCLTEWDYRRIVCPACEEENVHKLAIYTASQFEHIRVEACDSCKTYINTVDLTKNGLAIPEVDEYASVPLDLWAMENGYTKLLPNLLGF
jgi:FdhE protein